MKNQYTTTFESIGFIVSGNAKPKVQKGLYEYESDYVEQVEM